MDSSVLWAALALMLVFEGIFPFASPTAWRQMFQKIMALSDVQIRTFGLASILIGLAFLWLVS